MVSQLVEYEVTTPGVATVVMVVRTHCGTVAEEMAVIVDTFGISFCTVVVISTVGVVVGGGKVAIGGVPGIPGMEVCGTGGKVWGVLTLVAFEGAAKLGTPGEDGHL